MGGFTLRTDPAAWQTRSKEADMGRHSMDYQPDTSEIAGSGETAGTEASTAPATFGFEQPSPATPAPFPSATFNSIAPPGGPIDPGVPGAPDAPSYPEGPGYTPNEPTTFPYPSEPDAPSEPGPAPSEPDITPSEPDPIPEDDAGTPAHYGRWFAAEEQAS